ncbi:hypothetical protein GCM10027299_21590 [Larkinella ripae]
MIQLFDYNRRPLWVKTSEIMYLEGDADYTKFHLTGGRVISSSYSIKDYEPHLAHFWRISKSYLINPAYIHGFHSTKDVSRQSGSIRLKNGQRFDIARRRMGQISAKFLMTGIAMR